VQFLPISSFRGLPADAPCNPTLFFGQVRPAEIASIDSLGLAPPFRVVR
jgi:hypothetical protein